MKKTLSIPSWVWKAMKLSFQQFLLFWIVCGITYARESSGQAVLEKKVSLEVYQTRLKKVLSMLESQTDARFIYSPNSIDTHRKVSLTINNKNLHQVLDELFTPYSITFSVSDGRMISLKRTPPPSKEETWIPEHILHHADRTVSGRVTDEKGEALPGVNVVVKGTQRGIISDQNGYFNIDIPDENTVLVFSFVGYLSQEVVVGNRSSLEVSLLVDEKNLEEIVVIGYGAQSKRKLSTSISKVSSSEINHLPVALPGNALAGLAAGVQVQSGSGDIPGTAPTIRIRGIGSLGASNQPLYVIDGYPSGANEFSRINLSDIESIEILKDAASAAIYGSRAANGVIMVTTKRGQQGKVTFNLNTYTGLQSVAKKIEVMNKSEYLQYVKDARGASNLQYPDIYNNPSELPETDWLDEIFTTAPMSKIELSARGGNDKTRFSLSSSYLKQDGTMLGTDFQLFTLRGNLDAKVTEKFSIGANFAPSYSFTNSKPTPRSPGSWSYSPIYAAMLIPPVVAVRLPNGDYGQNNVLPHTQYGFSEVGVYNPVSVLELYKDQTDQFSIQNNLFIEWALLKNLTFRSQGGALITTSTAETYIPSTLANTVAPYANITNPLLNGIAASATSSRTFDWIWENHLTYQPQLGVNHNLTAMALYSMQKTSGFTTGTSGRTGSFTNDLVQNPTASADQVGRVSYGASSFLSYALRVNYDFRDKYLLSASVRRDGSSRFGPNNRFGFFQSYSAGWRLIEEEFMKQQHLFTDLKIRVSYGETGNASIGDFTWVSGMVASHYSFGDQRLPGSAPSGFLNRDLTWEKSKQTDIGLDAAFLRDRLSVTVDFYQKNTHGMLFSKELPGIVGYATSFQTNIGEIRNRGVEVDLGVRNTDGALKWTTNFNISYNKTKVLDLGGRESLNALPGTPGWENVYRIRVGEELGNFYGFVIDGVIKNQEQLSANPQWPGSGVGDYQIRDVNQDGAINESDRTLLGNGFPKLNYGLTNSLTYGDFDLSFIIQGVGQNHIINGASRHTELWAGRFNAVKEMANNYFDPANPDREVKYARVGPRSGFGTASNLHSYAVYNGAFLRVRNVTLGYTLPGSLVKKLSLSAAKLYVTAQNLLTFTKYPGFNPEPSQYGETVYQPGSDQATYPVNRSVMLGLNLSF